MPPNNSPYNPQVPQPGAPQPVQYPAQAPLNAQQTMQIPGQPMPAQQYPTQYPNQEPAPIQAPTAGAPVGTQNNEPLKPAVKNPSSTQNTLQLSELRDGMVIMLDGSFRAVVACKSINFDLMSDREREGVEYSYQNFLNSLNFPVQILVRSRRVDIGPYIEKLITTRKTQDNMLLGVLMDDYINFIDALADEANIMEKTFYITIPFFPRGDTQNFIEQGKGFFGKLFAQPKNAITHIDAAMYQKAKDEITNRVGTVTSGLFQLGVQSVQLDTKALGELYYNYYNPDTAVRQPLGDFDAVATTFVKRATPPVNPQATSNMQPPLAPPTQGVQ